MFHIITAPIRFIWTLLHHTIHTIFTTVTFLAVVLSLYLLLVPAWILLPGTLYRWVEEKGFCSIQYMVGGWLMLKRYHVVESGDSIESIADDEVVVTPNHQTPTDIAFLMWVFGSRANIGGKIMWVMDYILKYSHFGLVSLWRRDCFILQKSGAAVRGKQVYALSKHILHAYWPQLRKWIIIFPEGGFLRKRRNASQRYAQQHGYPHLDHVTLPRPTGLYAILDTASPHGMTGHQVKPTPERRPIKWILDVTMVYQAMHAVDELDLLFGRLPPNTTHIHYRKYPIQDVPLDSEDELRSWLYARWIEKEAIIKELLKLPDPMPANAFTWGEVDSSNTVNEEQQQPDGRQPASPDTTGGYDANSTVPIDLVTKYKFRSMSSSVTYMTSLYVLWGMIMFFQWQFFVLSMAYLQTT